MKKYCVWLSTGEKEIIEGSSASVEKKSDGLKIKIGSRIIKAAVGFTEVCETIKIQ